MKKVLLFLADGLEECEGLITVDLLRRAGVEVVTASLTDTVKVVSSHQIQIQADALLKDLDPEVFDMVVLPGGLKGTENLTASQAVADICLNFARRNDKQVAAICAAPSVLGLLGILKGKKATCYPGWEDKLIGAEYTGESVTECGNIVTGKGMGATIPFALHLISRLVDEETAVKVRDGIMYPFDF